MTEHRGYSPSRAALLCFLLGIVCPGLPAVADGEIEVSLRLDAEIVTLEDVLNLHITVIGAKTRLPQRIEVEGFEIGGRPSVSSKWVRRRTETVPSVTHAYQLYPKRTGEFIIGPYEFEIQGKRYVTNKVAVKVTERVRRQGGSEGGEDTGEGQPITFRTQAARAEKVLLRSEVDCQEVYIGQQVSLRVRLYTRLHVEKLRPGDQPDLTGFWIEDIPVSRSLGGVKTYIKGEKYTVYTIKRAGLFPTRSGELTIGPMSWEIGAAESDFFFSATRWIARTTGPLTIRVKPLPERGKPLGFRGAVGSFAIEAWVDHPSVEVNEAVTFSLKLAGRGNLRAIEEPILPAFLDFKTYTSKSIEDITPDNGVIQGSKTWEYVLVPKAPGEHVIPSIQFVSFDPQTDSYRTISSEPLPVKVEKGGTESLAAVANEVAKHEIRLVQQDINYIRLHLEPWHESHSLPLRRAPLVFLLVAPVLLNAGVFLYVKKRNRLRSEAGLVRFHKAFPVARKRLRGAGRHMDARNPGPFFRLLSDALIGFVADKFNMATAGLTKPQISDLLLEAGITKKETERVVAFLLECDRIRFAPVSTDVNAMKKYLKEAQSRLKSLEMRIQPSIVGEERAPQA